MNLLASDRVDIFENILWLKVSVELLLGHLKAQLLAILYICIQIQGYPRSRGKGVLKPHGQQPRLQYNTKSRENDVHQLTLKAVTSS